MPLPSNGAAWPPKALTAIHQAMEGWSAWYDGSAETLRGYYQGQQAANFSDIDRAAQHRGGVVGALARFWWGRPITSNPAKRVDQVHVPIAGDICRGSADLLYSEPPIITAGAVAAPTDPEAPQPENSTQARLDQLVDDGLHNVLATGAEVGAALGGRFHRVTWDKEVAPEGPFLTTVDADAAWPDFRWGRLVGVTFWYVVEVRGQEYWRHLERHEFGPGGVGLAYHALFAGTASNLGQQMALADHPATEPLAKVVAEDGAIAEGRTPGLLVEYVPNQTPNRRWRKHPIGRYLGRSDLDGIEGLMDNLDEAYSSWMRDIRLAKSRILIPEYMLRNLGAGQGASFNEDEDVFVPIKSAAPEDADANIVLNQFTIRVEEHERTCANLVKQILRSAGYSAQTFGEGTDGGAMTATEVLAKERQSYLTRSRKTRVERPAVARLLRKLLAVDATVFNTKGLDVDTLPNVEFGDSVQESPLTVAQTVQALDVARAASTEVKVRMVHPDWDDPQVDAEVALILGQQPAPAEDPFGITV